MFVKDLVKLNLGVRVVRVDQVQQLLLGVHDLLVYDLHQYIFGLDLSNLFFDPGDSALDFGDHPFDLVLDLVLVPLHLDLDLLGLAHELFVDEVDFHLDSTDAQLGLLVYVNRVLEILHIRLDRVLLYLFYQPPLHESRLL